jgi:hypothetical protein
VTVVEARPGVVAFAIDRAAGRAPAISPPFPPSPAAATVLPHSRAGFGGVIWRQLGLERGHADAACIMCLPRNERGRSCPDFQQLGIHRWCSADETRCSTGASQHDPVPRSSA